LDKEQTVGIRETLNQNPGLTTGVTAGIIVVALGIIIWQAAGGSGSAPSGPNKLFYSDDDGATYFADDVTKVPPFDHNGKPAVRAHVYKCKDGKKFVGYLERVNADFRARMEKARPGPGGQAALMEDAMIGGMEYKKPGATNKWVRQMTPDAQKVMDVTCPDGNREELEQLTP
jgi:hypothetical protein